MLDVALDPPEMKILIDRIHSHYIKETEAWAKRMGVGQVDLSLTHSKGMAAAVAILSIVEEDLK